VQHNGDRGGARDRDILPTVDHVAPTSESVHVSPLFGTTAAPVSSVKLARMTKVERSTASVVSVVGI
jgi:hypothetical protein